MDFDAILEGKEQPVPKKPAPQKQPQQGVKVTATDTRQRQQSCKVTDLDKDLLPKSATEAKNPAGFRVSVSDMLHIDTQDESLQNYKKALLGNIKED